MTGAAAASAATALTPLAGSPASAAAPLATAQAPGWYRYNVGSYQITVATDGKRSFKLPDSFVLNAKKDQVNEALLAAHMEKDMMTIPYSPIVINTGSKLIVVDTGVGEANFERSKGVSGQFQSNLKAAGIDRDKVDTVLISHFHGDHINGLIKPDGSPAFPNAEILVPAVEWKYFMDDGEMSRQTTDRMKEVFAGTRTVFDALKRKVTQYDVGKEVAPGITAVATYGHTPGHMSYRGRLGRQVALRAVRRHQPSGAVRPQSGLARVLRPGSADGGGHAPQGLRHAGRRQDDGAGLPLSVPGGGLCREGRLRLSGNSGDVGFLALAFAREQLATTGRPPAMAAFFLWRPGTPPRRIDLTSPQPPMRNCPNCPKRNCRANGA